MKISKKGRYALRALIYIALNNDEEKVTVSTIANANNISVKYLEQIFSGLKRAGIVRSIHGINGGYYLSREPNQITVEELLNAVEGEYKIERETTPEECMLKGISDTVQRCIIDEINEKTGDVISNITLQNLVDDYNRRSRDGDEMYYI